MDKARARRSKGAGGIALRTNGGRSRAAGQIDQLRQPRLAEMVASALRNEILSGRLREGDTLPRQEDLLEDFRVSPPAVREALRILETEGLIRVRRGNVGGAVVRAPSAQGVAYMVSMVLQFRNTPLADVSIALREVEPICAAMCARRPDRAEAVLPDLFGSLNDQLEALEDNPTFNQATRQFHERLVATCGNETMVLVVGALESLWSTHEQHVFESTDSSIVFRRGALRAHEKIAAAIEAGNEQAAANLARRHLEASQTFTIATGTPSEVIADLVRDDASSVARARS